MRYCIIKDAVVVNIVVWDGTIPWYYPLEHDLVVEDALGTVRIGWIYDQNTNTFSNA